MARRVSDAIVERLRSWGVDQVFGYPGDGVNGIVGAIDRCGIRFVQMRHEETAALAAVGYAKFSGRPGVCVATAGPGAIHLLNGLYDAKLDHVPVVAIVGQTARTSMGGSYQQEVDLHTLFQDVASAYVETATVPEQFPLLIDRALRIAITRRAPTAVIVPSDVQELAYRAPAHAHREIPGGTGLGRAVVVPGDDELRRAADVLNAGSRVAMLIGQGARGAPDEVMAVAARLGAGMAKALLGKDVLADDLPLVTGSIGLLGTRPSWELMQGCDTLLVVGSSFPYSEFLPEPGKARGVQIDLDPTMIGIRYPMEVHLVGDAAATLRRLLPLLEDRADRSWADEIRGHIGEWNAVLDARAETPAESLNPQLVFRELSAALPDDVVLTVDTGTVAVWYARHVRMRQGMRASLSGTLATMGSAVPYAIGAKEAFPDRPVVALVGDGAMQMNGLSELITIAQRWREWDDPRLVVLVLNNRDLSFVTWEMRAMSGNPRFPDSQDLRDVRYGDIAAMLGLRGIRVERPEAVASAWAQAFSADRPMVIDAVTDPEVPLTPPHVEWQQLRSLGRALAHGDHHRTRVVVQGLRERVRQLLAH